MIWFDSSKDFTAECFLCGARCSNKTCQAQITFDFHNYSRSKFAKKFNHRAKINSIGVQGNIFEYMEKNNDKEDLRQKEDIKTI